MPDRPFQERLGCWPLLPPEQRTALSKKYGRVVRQEPLAELERETRVAAAGAVKLSREDQARVGGRVGGKRCAARGAPACCARSLWYLVAEKKALLPG